MEFLTPPIDADSIFKGIHKGFELPENVTQLRSKPRVSSLMSDARVIAYAMAGTPFSDPASENPDKWDGKFTQEQGRLAEDITAEGINASGIIRVVNRQISLPDDYWATGHPDGELTNTLTIKDFEEDPTLVYEDRLIDGLKWGWEHKHLGRFQYKKIAKEGLYAGYPEIIAQMAVYGDALGWDACLACITSQDASSMRLELRGLKAHPKMMVFAVDLRPLYEEVIPYLQKRALWFSDWFENDGDPAHVAIEAKTVSKNSFPWGWTEYASKAIEDGPGTLTAPMTPLYRDWVK
jgi:hypothetical protein